MIKSKKEQPIIWKKRTSDKFETFAVELEQFTADGTLPTSCDRDMQYCLELQKKRQEEKGLRMQYAFVPRGHFASGGGIGRGYEDTCYKTRMEYRTCLWKRDYYRGEEKAYSRKGNYTFYQMITDTQDWNAVQDDNYTCPNCAAVSKVSELLNGCAYCGTFFQMQDLYPKTTNFFLLKDVSGTDEEIKKSVLKTMIPCIVALVIPLTITYNIRNDLPFLLNFIGALIGGTIGGGVIGYFLWSITKMVGIFKEAGQSMPMVASAFGSTRRFENRMKKYSPEFSYEYFTSKVISMLKMIIYAKNPQELPIYEGDKIDGKLSDIVDSYYCGALALKGFEIRGDYCYVTVDAYMEDVYDAKRLRKKRDKFRLVLRRNIKTPLQMNFSITRINCKNCGDSFDATKTRTCPSCNTRYEIADEDWVITKLTLKG